MASTVIEPWIGDHNIGEKLSLHLSFRPVWAAILLRYKCGLSLTMIANFVPLGIGRRIKHSIENDVLRLVQVYI